MIRPVLLALVALLSMAAWLGQALSRADGGRFLAGALPVWLVVVLILSGLRRQEKHRRPLGLATQITLARGLLLSALAGFIPLAPQVSAQAALSIIAILPGALYTTAALADLVDGYLARRWGEETALGARLDVAMDALGLVVAPVTAVALGRLPAYYLLVGAAYYLFHGGLWLRRRRGQPVYLERLKASRYTRMYAGYQMGLVATVLFPVVGPRGGALAATLFMIPTLTMFTRDWLVTTGWLDSGAPGYTRLLRRAGHTTWQILPIVRVLAAASLAAGVLQGRFPAILLLLALLLLLGVTTRLTAFVTAIPLTVLVERDPSLASFATLFVTLLCLLGGGGQAALLREDRLLLVRAGERAPAGPLQGPAGVGTAVVASADGGHGDLRDPLPVVEEDRR